MPKPAIFSKPIYGWFTDDLRGAGGARRTGVSRRLTQAEIRRERPLPGQPKRPRRGPGMAPKGQTQPTVRDTTNGRDRRIFHVPARSGGGLLMEQTVDDAGLNN
jgi:hypothetical protein